MTAWAGTAAARVRESGAVVLVTVVRTQGSAPRDAGARMLVGATESMGTIGGGNLEHLAMAQARLLLGEPSRVYLQQDIPLGPITAQCCGGRVMLLIEKLDESALPWLAAVDALGREGAVRMTRIVEGEHLVRTAMRSDDPLMAITLRDASGAEIAPSARSWLQMDEVVARVGPTVMLFGAGHVGRALAPQLTALDFDLRWIDSRADVGGVAGIEVRQADDPVVIVAEAPKEALYVVMTHNHDLDYDIVRSALARGDAAYVGLIGSPTKRARFLTRLAKDGIADAETRLTCPIGDFGLRDKAPAAIAACVAVELLRVRERA